MEEWDHDRTTKPGSASDPVEWEGTAVDEDYTLAGHGKSNGIERSEKPQETGCGSSMA
jgi:hypothetical protein